MPLLFQTLAGSTPKVSESIHCTESLDIGSDVAHNVRLSWGRLMQDFCFLCEAEVTAGSNELVHTELHIGFRSGIEGTIISKEEVSDTVCHDLDFGLEVKQLAICTVFDADSNVAVSEAVGQHCKFHENTHTHTHTLSGG